MANDVELLFMCPLPCLLDEILVQVFCLYTFSSFFLTGEFGEIFIQFGYANIFCLQFVFYSLKSIFYRARFLTFIKANLSFLKTLKKYFLQQRTLWLNPTHKHGMILHLFILNLISSINVSLFLAYRFCTRFAEFKLTKLQN